MNNRGTLDNHLEEIARRVLPDYSGSFTGRGNTRTPGDKRTEEMVDATAALALTRFAAAMESMLTPRNSVWHSLVPSDDSLMRNRTVRLWFEALTKKLFKYRYSPKANFASQKHEDYMALGAFGTGCMFIDSLYDQVSKQPRGLRYSAIHLGEIYFFENHQGIIDTAMRRFSLSARQAAQMFSDEELPEQIKTAVKNSGETKFWFVHCVKPREEIEGYDPDRRDIRGMAFASYYVSETGKKTVREGGYHTFPYSISRYVIAPGEIYGRSPAMLALPAINVLNEEKKTVLKLAIDALNANGMLGIQIALDAIGAIQDGEDPAFENMDLVTYSELLTHMQNAEADEKSATLDFLVQVGDTLGRISAALLAGILSA